ncbi:MAG: S41 family peptidase [Prevotellaceae bacterium]|jgi:carboxyl-terminal processing protease|nr:S41 family peptidase [Prevotellaceae bacterium]
MKRIQSIIIAFIAVSQVFAQLPAAFMSPEMQKLNMAVMAVNNLYVDTVSQSKVVEDAITGMLEKLDPHSVYIPKDEVEKANEPLDGNFEGIGVQFNMLEDTLLVVQTISGGPSERVGIMAGDRIVIVDGEAIAGVKMQNSDIMKRLRGAKGTEVDVQILRRGVPGLIDFKIIRDKIPIYSLDAAYMAGEGIGYIKLNRFSATTVEEYKEAFDKLKKSSMKSLILDLEGNGGGYLNAATALADEFLSGEKLIVYTDGENVRRTATLATSAGGFEKGNLIILVDEGSASASEIVSGAVQDWDRGLLVGRRTFGKGLVQRPIPLLDGSMMRLTVARYYTPSGRSIQRPYERGKEKYQQDLLDRYEHGELYTADSISFADSLKYTTKVLKRTVYGGGGIMPDIFIPRDTSGMTSYYTSIINSGVLYLYALNYSDGNREKLASYKTWEELHEYLKTQPILQSFTDFAAQKGIKKRPALIQISADLITNQLQAYIVRNFFDNAGFYPIFQLDDKPLLKAVEVLKQGKSLPTAEMIRRSSGLSLHGRSASPQRFGYSRERQLKGFTA